MKKQIKRITAVAAAAALAISFTFPAELGLADLGVGGNAIVASAESSGNCGDNGSNVTWSLDDNGTLTISGSGKIEDYRSDIDQPWYSNRSDITSVIIEPGVTSIGLQAFYYCSNLTSITIPSGLTSIGEMAFFYCSALTSVTIPNSVISIGNFAFGSCTGLKSITIPSSVTSIENNVFQDCTGLTNITVDSSNPSFCSESGVLFNKDKTTLIYCPRGKTGSYTIPDGVTAIEDYAFYYCSGLTSVTIPSSVTSIGVSSFQHCTGLTSITIPNSVTSIVNLAFWDCSSLTIVYIPSGVNFVPDESGLTGDFISKTATKITYTVDSSNNVTITDISLSSVNTVDIPPEIDGKKVIAVDEDHRHKVGNHTCVTNTTPTCIKKATCGICGQDYYGDHDLSHHDAVPPTCTTDGNVEYWECSLCQKDFSDDKGTAEITDIVKSALGHSLIKTDEKAHTCTDDGNIEYWKCSVCQKYFSDANGTNEITNIVDPAPGHSLVKTDAKAPTCTDDGNIEYWECSVCGKKFSDANGTNEITNIVDPAKHSLVKTDAKAPTCNNDGNKAYWTCTECGNIFSDDAGLNPTTLADVTISATNHSWSKDWSYDGTGHWHACSGCDKKVDFEAHTKNSGTVTIQPTATTAGVRVYFCSVCGYGIRTEIIPAMGVNYYPTYPVISTPNAFTENLTVNAEESGSTVILSWNGIKNADKYYVYQYKDRKYVKIKTTADNSVEINGLKNGVTYKFLVRYTIGGKLSPMTYSYKITVKVYYKPVVKAASTENSVRLIWKAVPNAEKYAVYKYVDGKAVKLCETEKLAVRINKLSPDTEYKYIVRAYVDGKWTAMMTSDIVTIKTKAE